MASTGSKGIEITGVNFPLNGNEVREQLKDLERRVTRLENRNKPLGPRPSPYDPNAFNKKGRRE